MSRQLINRSADLRRLQEAGYQLSVHGGYLLIHHIPYVTAQIEIRFGTLITTLSLAGNTTTRPDTHVIYFDGGEPCHKDGMPITAIQHSSGTQQLSEGLVCQRSFSNKPAAGYQDYYEKVETYVNILSSPAASIDPNATAKTFLVSPDEEDDSPFCYPDTNSSRAGIDIISAKLRGLRIGIVGLGGTGGYVLDLVAKTPVGAIHIFDKDVFLQHNAFRAPGAADLKELEGPPAKAEYFQAIYRRMHRHIIPHILYLDEDSFKLLEGLDFVFLCLDKNAVRNSLMAELIRCKIPFIDSGIGVEAIGDQLIGTVRVTSGTPCKHDHLSQRVALDDFEEDLYRSNIQIAELNMLSASLAVIQWKKWYGFYQDLNREHHTTYTINTHHLDDTDHTI